ncbi:RluA family pseudouridine synthase [Sorangium cellulosum]|uniref:Pseudouridine synthase n=1 Tax=Sorangium cellulosum TaxID=56 RepID=A0A150QJ29_SORCE|nr:RluA family pseudouridine synthase [Sorangium cellulosum]KYF67933.1 ribosomal large subunit pseudouridine synthase D [Sorangium cellulosum]
MAAGAEALHFQVGDGDPRDRLDKLVVLLLERAGRSTSRAAVQRWIGAGRVLVDGEPARASVAVRSGALLEIRPEPPPPSSAAAEPDVVIPVVYEDEHLLVIDKPAGLVVHPARGHESGTLVNGLLALPGFALAPADPRDPMGHVRPGIVHRLDRGTSGLLVVAKDEVTREALKERFARHAIEREYAAIVAGEARDATYDTLHARHPTDRLRFTSWIRGGAGAHAAAPRRAVTHVRVLERLGDAATVVACSLETGRTHQIRVHLAERGRTPVLGDPLYGKPPKKPAVRAIAEELGRQALHARVLGFIHPATQKPVRWESALPADMRRALDQLRGLATRSSI